MYKANYSLISHVHVSSIKFSNYSISAHNTIEVIVPINGYYTRRVDGVLFSYKGYKFNRTLNISDVLTKYGKDITKECELKLSLYELYETLDFFIMVIYSISSQAKSVGIKPMMISPKHLHFNIITYFIY